MTRLTDYLDRRDIGYEVLEHDRTFTGIDEARALGVKADEDQGRDLRHRERARRTRVAER